MILIIVSPNYIVLANMILTLSSILAKSGIACRYGLSFFSYSATLAIGKCLIDHILKP